MVERTTIKFEDMPKALAYLIEKVEELDRKLESLGDTSTSGKDMWMGIKEVCAYLPMRPATQNVYGWTSAHPYTFPQEVGAFHVPEVGNLHRGYENEKWSAVQTAALHLCGVVYFY